MILLSATKIPKRGKVGEISENR